MLSSGAREIGREIQVDLLACGLSHDRKQAATTLRSRERCLECSAHIVASRGITIRARERDTAQPRSRPLSLLALPLHPFRLGLEPDVSAVLTTMGRELRPRLCSQSVTCPSSAQ